MQQVQAIRPEGSIIQDRYIVERLLGKGGFSAVYLVRDRRIGKKFALKELTDHDKQEKNRFFFECQVLQRLDSPLLPHVYEVIEDEDQIYMLMEYIDGPNLEVLRKQQPGNRFTLSQTLTFLAPIVEAVSYLHHQEPPILHRDIKPSNIIAPQQGGQSVLVDFGIAKEYNSEETTTAVRHCSPGYGAPEQYGIGTDPRTDIYGFGATLYALLSGTVPIDSQQRTTQVASKKADPLVPIQQLLPDIPEHVAHAIHRAMAINSDERFPTIEEFWQAVQYPSASPSSDTSSSRSDVQSYTTDERSTGPIVGPPVRPFRTSGTEVALLAFLALAVIIGVVLGVRAYTVGSQTVPLPSTLQHPAIVGNVPISVPTPTVPPPTSNIYPNVVGPYAGTIYNQVTNAKSTMMLTGIDQHDNSVNGYFTGLAIDGPFTGVLDTSRHFVFTVTSETAKASFYFEGNVRQDGNIVGNFCRIDSAGQCVGDSGIWSVKGVQGP